MNRFSENLILIHSNGDRLIPYKMLNRDTGKIAYRLSKKGNTKTESIEVDDELEMIRKVTEQNYSVRARKINSGSACSLYRLNQRSIRCFELKTASYIFHEPSGRWHITPAAMPKHVSRPILERWVLSA